MPLNNPLLTALLGSLLLLSVAQSAGAGAEAPAPVLFASNGADLLRSRALYDAGDERTRKTVQGIVNEADKGLDVAPFSVVNKKNLPPSGDKHDYTSLSPYWWPDPSKPDGKPYIRRDGEFNPERAEYDLEPLERMSRAVDALSMAYFFTRDEKYARKTAELLRAWFIDPATRMNPNLKYAQFVPGYDRPRPSGIIEGGRLRKPVDAVGLISGSPAWSSQDDAALRQWFGELKQYLLTSEQGRAEGEQPNNHGTWYAVQVGTYALFAGQTEPARDILESSFKRLLDSQLKPDGSQPEEMARTLSLHYHRFNTLALIELATLGDRVGLDLWNYKTPDGRSIRTAIDYLIPYFLEEKKWEGQQIRPANFGDFVVIARRAANAFDDPRYAEVAAKLQAKHDRDMVDLLFPAKAN
jgi:hypothetical protein